MDKKIKAKWVKALRSGKYKKTTGQLYKDAKVYDKRAGFCCLGVLTDLYLKEHPKAKGWNKGAYYGTDSDLSRQVMKWAGLKSSDPIVPFKKNTETLSVINDRTRTGFKGIATLISNNL